MFCLMEKNDIGFVRVYDAHGGKMKVNWEIKKLKDICDKGSSNVNMKSLDKMQGEYPIYGASGFIQNVNFYHQEKEYIGIIKDGSGIGRTMLLPPKSSVIGTLQYILPKEGNSIHFINYALQSLDLSKYKQGAAIPHIYFRDYGETEIVVPPLAEQKRIVALLDQKFAAVGSLKANAQSNLQNAKDLFQAELGKQFGMQNSECGIVKLGDVCEFISGYAFESKKYSLDENDTLLICGDNIVHCDFRWETIKKWNSNEYEGLKRFALQENDIVLAMDRPWVKTGLKIAMISNKEIPSLLVQRTAALRANSYFKSKYIYYALLERGFTDYLLEQQTGVGVPHISGKQIQNYEIVFPRSPSTQSEDLELCGIVEHLDSLQSKVRLLEKNYEKVIADCDELKQSYLDKAFKGEL